MSRRRLACLGGAGVLLVGMTLVAIGSSSAMVGPWARLVKEVLVLERRAPQRPSASVALVAAVVTELWDRNWYGTTASRMIMDSPFVGAGVGSFHLLVPDVAHELGHGRLEPDNAQNWFRHQFAEFGVLGSVGWLLWMELFLRLLAAGRPVDGRAAPADLVRRALVALGLASLVGMPTQDAAGGRHAALARRQSCVDRRMGARPDLRGGTGPSVPGRSPGAPSGPASGLGLQLRVLHAGSDRHGR